MLKSYAKTTHTPILSRLILILTIASIPFLVPKNVSALTCCPVNEDSQYQYVYNTTTGKCVLSGPHGSVSINTQCSATQSCDGTNCVDEQVTPSPPSAVSCGYLNQACCSPFSGSGTACISGLNPSKEIKNINDLTGCVCQQAVTASSDSCTISVVADPPKFSVAIQTAPNTGVQVRITQDGVGEIHYDQHTSNSSGQVTVPNAGTVTDDSATVNVLVSSLTGVKEMCSGSYTVYKDGDIVVAPTFSDPTAGCPDDNGDGIGDGINTALGCIPVETEKFIPAFLRFIVGIAGGIALILMLIGAAIFTTGGSNPDQVARGKEIFSSALTGLLFIIFSGVALQIIAGDIIKLPGF